MRFILQDPEQIKTRLRFDFYSDDQDKTNTKVISILEEDVFTFEPVFYKVIPNYKNYGHWGKHRLINDQIDKLLIELDSYKECLINKTEKDYFPELTAENFGTVYSDINLNRSKIISLIENFYKWIQDQKIKLMIICGI